MAETFSLTTREEVIRFEELLDKYTERRAKASPRHISLVMAYDSLRSHASGGRIFSALMDVQLNFFMVYLDTHAYGSTWNDSFSPGKLEGGSVLDSEEKFFGKMDMHRASTSYVLRYRAIWDKVLGLLVLMYAEAEYESFINAKSRKKAFQKIVERHKFLNEAASNSIRDLLTRFDDSFRTPEAHGPGVLRKYSFTMESLADSPQLELIGFWNAINQFIGDFAKVFVAKGKAEPTGSVDSPEPSQTGVAPRN